MVQSKSLSKSESNGQDADIEHSQATFFFRLHFSKDRVEDYPLTDTTYSIGRALQSSIRIPSTANFLGISLKHGTIEIDGNHILYTDHSTNGTSLTRKGSEVSKLDSNKKYRLEVGDILTFDTLKGELIYRDVSMPGTLVKKDVPCRTTVMQSTAGPQKFKRKYLSCSDIPDGEKIEITEGITKIGRHHENHIVIEDKKEYDHVSRFHGEIHVEGLKWGYKDIGSANGSHIKRRDGNFYRLKANQLIPLIDQTVIRIGLSDAKGKEKVCDMLFFEEE